MRLDHIGIAVPDLETALAFWRDGLGLSVTATESVPSQGALVAFLDSGETRTELLAPTDADSPIQRFLDAGRKGLHHIAYRVEDIDGRLRQLRAASVPLVHEHAVPGSGGSRVAFVHPRGTGGVLVELVELPAKDGGRR